jgi:hypothetical protein
MEEEARRRILRQQEEERQAMFASPVYDADFWRMACIAALTGVKMGLANQDAVAEAVKAADDVLEAFRKRFRRTELAEVVSLPTRQT